MTIMCGFAGPPVASITVMSVNTICCSVVGAPVEPMASRISNTGTKATLRFMIGTGYQDACHVGTKAAYLQDDRPLGSYPETPSASAGSSAKARGQRPLKARGQRP